MARKPSGPDLETSLRMPLEDARIHIEARITEGEKIFAGMTGDGRAALEQFKVWDAFDSQLMRKRFLTLRSGKKVTTARMIEGLGLKATMNHDHVIMAYVDFR